MVGSKNIIDCALNILGACKDTFANGLYTIDWIWCWANDQAFWEPSLAEALEPEKRKSKSYKNSKIKTFKQLGQGWLDFAGIDWYSWLQETNGFYWIAIYRHEKIHIIKCYQVC